MPGTPFLPELLGATARVRSTCRATGRSVTLTVTAHAVLEVRPREAVVLVAVPERTDDIRSTFCGNVMFFASPRAGRTWLASQTHGSPMTIEDAYDLGRLTNQRCFKPRQDAAEGATA